MVRVLLVDDEPWARANLRVLLKEDSDVELIGECGNGEEARREIIAKRPDVLFLDVRMPDQDGFEVLEQVGLAVPPVVIFVTAYEQYAIQAFEVAALDYLLKPFENERLQRALARAKEALGENRSEGRMIVRNAGRVAFLRNREVDWIEAADYYACLHAGGKNYMMRKTIAELERELGEEMFCRIHRSTIVNLERVGEVRTDRNGEPEAVMRDGRALRISRSYKRNFQEKLRSVLKWDTHAHEGIR